MSIKYFSAAICLRDLAGPDGLAGRGAGAADGSGRVGGSTGGGAATGKDGTVGSGILGGSGAGADGSGGPPGLVELLAGGTPTGSVTLPGSEAETDIVETVR